MKPPSNIRCPMCRKVGAWLAGEFAPFCSKRCRLLDLGKWFNEEHAVSSPLRPEHFTDFEELPPGKNPDAPEMD
jgi:endogenous inhibitor of DNA gyrase (YacG/DUF329 family)